MISTTTDNASNFIKAFKVFGCNITDGTDENEVSESNQDNDEQ